MESKGVVFNWLVFIVLGIEYVLESKNCNKIYDFFFWVVIIEWFIYFNGSYMNYYIEV